MKTKTKKFEFYSETLKEALEAHAAKHKVSVDEVLEACDYQARGEKAFIPTMKSLSHWDRRMNIPWSSWTTNPA